MLGAAVLQGCGGGGSGTDAGPSSILTVLGAPVGQAGNLKTSTTPVVATFQPAHQGAAVVIEEKVDGSWKDVAEGKQNSNGRFLGQVEGSSTAGAREFRARTDPAKGDPMTSKTVTSTPMRKVWADEFDGAKLDPRKWQTRVQPPGGLRQCATPAEDRIAVRGGVAVLSVKKAETSAQCPEGVWSNAMVGTGGVTSAGCSAAYGVFAARVKFQASQGMHGSFWMQGPKEAGAEIDVAEYFGDGREDGGLSNYVHYTDTSGKVSSSGGPRRGISDVLGAGAQPSDDFHVYSVEWTPRQYVFRVDGKQTFRTSKPAVASAEEIMILSLLTSDYELPRMEDATSTMKVDWVRAWQK